jgi:hypothetical protein
MIIKYSKKSLNQILKVVRFVENKNTFGSGVRWFESLEIFLHEELKYYLIINKCKNKTFETLMLRI